jgi:type II secretory pathway component PulK
MIARRHFRARCADAPGVWGHAPERAGSVLLAVLVIVVLLSLAGFQYSELMFAEYRAADSSWKAIQARAAAESGVHYAAGMLSNPDAFSSTLNSNPYDNQGAFANIPVGVRDGTKTGSSFSIVTPVPVDSAAGTAPSSFRYGVIDESGKINLNALLKIDSTGQAAHDILMKLPNMTEEIADAVVDWLDPDDDQRTNGAESSYYSALDPPYRCKNGPLDTLEELLWVRGVTPQLLFGTDLNRNGIQDPGEDTGNGWDPGWSAYLTVYSRERNVDASNNPRTFLNDTNLSNQHTAMVTAVGQSLADFITLYRTQSAAAPASTATLQMAGGQGGAFQVQIVTGGGGGGNTRAATAQEIADKIAEVTKATGGQSKSLASRYDLIDASVSWTIGAGRNQTTLTVPSPLQSKNATQIEQLLPTLIDKTTTQQLSELPARVNVNTAPRAVLMSLPGTTDTEVQSILDNQPGPNADPTDTTYQTQAWLMTKANLSKARMTALERYVTARTQVYRVQSIGQLDGGGPVARVEAVIDTNPQAGAAGKPRILMMRPLSDLGRGYDLSANQ